ncbi:MFS transporter [Noviherbaspirillum sp.]|uniref:MFS transporter n=1 Tax=Noviherbaspirillum sp. TaxID=1926288 RepID=UPI002D41CB8E|nr:MFS transporter [Noviherbaspirillum sp.]HZW23330.1 MFS transporter [Noviherbaspirillum sp.]
MNTGFSAGLSQDLVRKISWRITPVLMLMYFMCIIDRVNLGYASLTMNKELGLTAAQYGFAAGLLYMTYILCEVPSNILLHRTSPRIWFTRIMITWGLCSAATGLIQNETHLYTARLLLGAAEAGLFPGVLYYLTRWLPREERVSVVAMFMMAAPIAFVVGAPVSGYLIDHASVFGYSGWRAMLIIEGLIPVALGLMLPFILTNTPEEAKWLSATEKSAIRSALAEEEKSAIANDHGFLKALADGKVWALGFVFFGINVTFSILFWFLPQMVAGFKSTMGGNLTTGQIGMISASPFATAAIAMLVYGFWLKGKATTVAHVSGPIAVAALGTVIPAMSASPYVIMVGLCMAAAGAFCAMVSFWQLPPMIFKGRTAASGIAMVAAIGVSSNAVIPWINGYIKDMTGSLDGAMMFNGGVIVLALITAIVISFKLTRQSRAPIAEASGIRGTARS